MRRRTPRSPVAIGVIALAAVVVMFYLGFSKDIPFKTPYEVNAVFESANSIRPGSPVRIAGVEVGEVKEVKADEDNPEAAVVVLQIDDDGLPLHADATAKIRPRIFLEGNFFVDLTAGSPSAPELEDGATIPVQQTATPVQIDEVLTALQSDTREDLKVLLREYGKALDGAGARGFNRSIPHWEPAYRDSAIVGDAMRGETGRDLSGYVENAGATAAALDRNREQLKSLITDFHVTAAAFAREEGNLRTAIGVLPRTLDAAMPALAALNESFPPLRALAVELRPAVPDLAALIERSVPLYRQVRRAASCQNSVIHPWSVDTVQDEQFPAQGKVFQEAPKPLPGLAGESRSGDANGQWFRVLAAGGKNLVTLKPGVFATTPEPLLGANPPRPSKRPPLDAEVPCETQEPPDLRSDPAPPPEQRTVDTSSAAFRDRYAKARGKAVDWLRDQLKAEGLEDLLKVVEEDITEQLVGKLK